MLVFRKILRTYSMNDPDIKPCQISMMEPLAKLISRKTLS